MDLKDFLTNEKIAKKFKSQFDLVSYAIKLAENMIRSGRDCRVKTDIQNRSMQVLSEILNNKDQFDEIIIEEKIAVKHSDMEPFGKSPLGQLENHTSKSSEKKKARRVFLEETNDVTSTKTMPAR